MQPGNCLFANILSGIVAFAGLFIISLFGLSPVSFLAAILLAVLIYWRFIIFPVTGWALLKAIIAWMAFCVAAAMTFTFIVSMFLAHKGNRVHEGLGITLLGVACAVGILSGIAFGVQEYRRLHAGKPARILITAGSVAYSAYAVIFGACSISVGAQYNISEFRFWGLLLLASTALALIVKKLGRVISFVILLSLIVYSSVFLLGQPHKNIEVWLVTGYFIIPPLIIAGMLAWELRSKQSA